MKKQLLGVLAIAMLVGCAGAPQPEPAGHLFTPQEAGPRPDLRLAIAEYLADVLKDPGVALVSDIAGPAFLHIPGERLNRGIYGWGICFTVSPDNAIGGEADAGAVALLWRHGAVQGAYWERRGSLAQRQHAVDVCNEIRRQQRRGPGTLPQGLVN
jgi:hypothetical protein